MKPLKMKINDFVLLLTSLFKLHGLFKFALFLVPSYEMRMLSASFHFKLYDTLKETSCDTFLILLSVNKIHR